MSKPRLFVYGTLMQGEPNAACMADSRFVGPALTKPLYELLNLGDYPAMRGPGKTAVAGELYEVDPEMLEALDNVEDENVLYKRTRIALADGTDAEAYLLVPGAAAGPPIPSGDWRKRAAKGK